MLSPLGTLTLPSARCQQPKALSGHHAGGTTSGSASSPRGSAACPRPSHRSWTRSDHAATPPSLSQDAGGAPRNTPPPCTHCLHRMAKRWEDGLGELSAVCVVKQGIQTLFPSLSRMHALVPPCSCPSDPCSCPHVPRPASHSLGPARKPRDVGGNGGAMGGPEAVGEKLGSP